MRIVFIALAVTLCCFGQPSAASVSVTVKVVMRDGIGLSTNLFRPAGSVKVPTILIRTPYNKGKGIAAGYRLFLQNGYAVVVQDVRGRYESDGIFAPHDQEEPDGEDTLEWIAKQSWSDGQVGMVGGSYLGIVQWKLALRNNPHLKAIFPIVSGNDDYRDRFYSRGGAVKLGNRLSWMAANLRAQGSAPVDFSTYVRTLPLRVADMAATGQISKLYYQPVLDHPTYDEFWKKRSVREHLEKMKIPVFSVGGWYDNFVEGDLEAFSLLRKAGKNAYAAIGPWPHSMSTTFEGVSFGSESSLPISKLQLDWFNHWMKTPNQTKLFPGPHLRLFVMGRNRWRGEPEWPVKSARPTSFYLSSKKAANTLEGGGRLTYRTPMVDHLDSFDYDPSSPVPTLGGAVCCTPAIFPWGPKDQRTVERRQDVLVYSSDILEKEMEVTGPVTVILYATSTALDTDFTAKLVDVFPNGMARNLCDGILRMRYRDSLSKPELAKPGKIYKLVIEAGVTSNVFLPGHRIRIEVSSSNFPRFDRNLNTGGSIADDDKMQIAHQTVHYGRNYPSKVLLSVVSGLSSLTGKPALP